MTPDAVATYLHDHPEFFERYADMLADIYIPHPHGGRAIPISERQILALRERVKQLETRLREVIQFGEENDAIGEKVHRLALAVVSARELPALAAAIDYNLREDFAVPHVALKLWQGDNVTASEALRTYAGSLTVPYCGSHVPREISTDLFGEAAPLLQSFSVITLNADGPFGVLALASEDAKRFYPEMGIVYLKRIGELVAAAVQRCA
jgi:uncharacterized protein YigA (DUF484 family)